MTKQLHFIVVLESFISKGWKTESIMESDFKKFNKLSDAQEHGFTLGRSDDFNIALIDDDNVLAFFWMDKLVGQDLEVATEKLAWQWK